MSGELEAMDPTQHGGRIAYEHMHRYALCREFVHGRRVLDLACGSGYGTSILGAASAKVTGVDANSEAIRAARKAYGAKNVEFLVGDGLDLPFKPESFEVVVANLMNEHANEYDARLTEISRVLSNRGILLVSFPSKIANGRNTKPGQLRASRMEAAKIRKLLTTHFAHVRLTGLRMALLSVGFGLDAKEAKNSTNLDAARIHLAIRQSADNVKIETGELQLADPDCIIAVCSNAPLEKEALPSSIFFSRDDDLWLEQEKLLAGDNGLHKEEGALRVEAVRTRDLLDQEKERSATLEAERARMADQLQQLRETHAVLTEALEGERKTHAREVEAVQREVSGRLETIAAILAKMGSAPATADDPGILASLFEINQALVTERLKRAQMEQAHGELVARMFAVQTEVREANAHRQYLVTQLAEREKQWESERRVRADLEAERQVLEGKLRSAADRLAEEIAIRDAELEKERQLLATLRSELEVIRGERERARQDAVAAERRRESVARGGDSMAHAPLENRVSRNAPSAADTRAERADQALNVLHSRIATMVGAAAAQVAGRIAPAPKKPPLPWHRRVLGKTRPLPTKIFSPEWLARQAPNIGEVSLRAFVENPEWRAFSPHPLFDAAWYLKTYPDVAESGMSPLVHYVLHGWREGRDPHPLFTNDWYLARNPDVAAFGEMSALDHYLMHGWREGRNPNPLFNPRRYLERYPDVEEADFEPLSHFIMHGETEGREITVEGWGHHLPDIARQGGPLQAMRQLLREQPAAHKPTLAVDSSSAQHDPSLWPPAPVDDFWPTNTMREMIAETHGEPLLGRIWYLLSLMNRWQDRQAEFVNSSDCAVLLKRLRERAGPASPDSASAPAASVIVPVHNNVLDTLLCLASLLELDDRHDFEIIVADDGSSDATRELIPAIGGKVQYLRQPNNLGFLGNCNAAASEARGSSIVLLNNDTLVFTGWLDGLLDPIDTMPDVGMVGSKLINWDGTLQEAGGIFWRDGSAWNFGRNQDALAPEFNYLKDVDYCSGASIAVPAHIWREVGGFDPTYSPAYCEDSDLAFRLRAAGYRTLYSPASEVVHHEGRSHGRDVSSGMKAYQVTNTAKLLERWRDVLERDHYASGTNVLRARDRSFAKRHILVVDHYVPQWDRDAGSRTMLDFLQVLVEAGHAVTFWPDNLWRDPTYTPRLQAMGVEVIYGPRFRGGFDKFLTARQGLYDMVLLSRPHIAINYIKAIKRHSAARIVYYGHDIHFRRMMTERKLAGLTPADDGVLAMQAQEVEISNHSDLVLYPSAEEAKLIRDLARPGLDARAIAAYRYMPSDLAEARQRLLEKSGGRDGLHLLFVGGFGHPPNTDAVVWFCQSVMPLLRKHAPAPVRFTIAGSRPTAEVVALEQSDVEVLGFVSDRRLQELYANADVAVAPLRCGAGVKGKVIEAMARGLPVVTTHIGAQGIENAADVLFLGDTAEELAEQVLRAADPATARQQALSALDYVKRNYSTEVMLRTLELGLPTT